MSEQPKYVNGVPSDYDGPRCQYAFQLSIHWGRLCGLPAWPHAPEEEPICLVHSQASPGDIRYQLEQCARTGAKLDEANLAGAHLQNVQLAGATMWYADLSGAHLTQANLSGAALLCTNFAAAEVMHADLSGAVLMEAELPDSTLMESDLSGADLCGANLSAANLLAADLCGADLSYASLRNADLRSAKLGVLWDLTNRHDQATQLTGRALAPRLRETDLRGAHLLNVTIVPEADFAGAKFGPVADHPAEDRIRDEADPEPQYDACAEVYRQLKLAFQDSGDYGRAGNFFIGEMRCLRKQMARDGGKYLQRLGWWLFEKIAGYGERPWNVALTALLVTVTFALIHTLCGINRSPADAVLYPITQWYWPSALGLHDLWAALKAAGLAWYFSIVTFTTLGYGDFEPANGVGRFFSSVEAALGMVLVALFLVSIVRKFSR